MNYPIVGYPVVGERIHKGPKRQWKGLLPRAGHVYWVTCEDRCLQQQGALPRHTSAGFQNQLAIKIGCTAHLQRKSVSE